MKNPASFDCKADLCYYNFQLIVKYLYDSFEEFIGDIDKGIQVINPDYSRDDVRKERNYINDLWKRDRNFGDIWQGKVESYLTLPTGSLMSPYFPRTLAYILIFCRGNDAQRLQRAIKLYPAKWRIVEDCVMVSGTAALILKIYGTEFERTQLLVEDIYNVEDVDIYRTETNQALQEYLWERYEIDEFKRQSSPPYWYPEPG